MPPSEVLDRFTEQEMIRLLAYQNLYGPITGERFDLLFARLGMDVAAPHMKKGKKPRLRDHLLQWSRRSSSRKSPEQLLSTVRGLQRRFDRASTDRRRVLRSRGE